MVGYLLRLMGVIFIVVSFTMMLVIVLRPVEPRPLLAFVGFEGDSVLMLRDVDRGVRHALVQQSGISEVSWSSGGRWLAYVRRINNLNDAYLFDLLTGSNYLLLGDSGSRLAQVQLYAPMWSPDGRVLALPYEARENQLSVSDDTALVLSDSQIGDVRFLFANNLTGVWTPDSTSYVYYNPLVAEELLIRPTRCAAIWQACRYLVESVNLRQPHDRIVGWMPNGRELMMTYTYENTQPAIYRLDVHNGTTNRLIDGGVAGAAPAWSPDGQSLAVGLVRGLGLPGVYLLNADGDEKLIWSGIAGEFGWTPQSDRLVFEGLPVTGTNDTRAIYVYDRGTNAVTRLSPSGQIETTPVWGTFRGRAFAWWVVLGFDGMLIGLWWLVGARHASPLHEEI